jgi:lysophospholipase L1-like esterase
MNNQLKYLLGAAVVVPCLPIIYFQGQLIKKSVPKLPEASGVEGMGKTAHNKAQEKPFRLLCLGESTMAGVGAETHKEAIGGSIAKEISQKLKTDVFWRVYARNGYTAKRLRFKILPKIVERDFDLIVIALGGNDAFALNSPATWRKNILALLKETQELFPNTPIVFMNMPPIKEFPAFTSLIKFSVGNLVQILGSELELIVKDREEVYFSNELIEFTNWLQKYNMDGDRLAFFSDGVHPSVLSYQIWAKDVVDFIFKNKVLKV